MTNQNKITTEQITAKIEALKELRDKLNPYQARRDEIISNLFDRLSCTWLGERIPFQILDHNTAEILVDENKPITQRALKQIAQRRRSIRVDCSSQAEKLNNAMHKDIEIAESELKELEDIRDHIASEVEIIEKT